MLVSQTPADQQVKKKKKDPFVTHSVASTEVEEGAPSLPKATDSWWGKSPKLQLSVLDG